MFYPRNIRSKPSNIIQNWLDVLQEFGMLMPNGKEASYERKGDLSSRSRTFFDTTVAIFRCAQNTKNNYTNKMTKYNKNKNIPNDNNNGKKKINKNNDNNNNNNNSKTTIITTKNM